MSRNVPEQSVIGQTDDRPPRDTARGRQNHETTGPQDNSPTQSDPSNHSAHNHSASDPDRVTLTVDLPEDLHELLSVIAAEDDSSPGELIRQMLEEDASLQETIPNHSAPNHSAFFLWIFALFVFFAAIPSLADTSPGVRHPGPFRISSDWRDQRALFSLWPFATFAIFLGPP